MQLERDARPVRAALDVYRRVRMMTNDSRAVDDEHVRPELRIRLEQGSWQIESVADAYPQVFGSDPAAQHIHWRQLNVLNVAKAIFERQQGFLSNGAVALRAVTGVQVAATVGLDESTISRLVNSRYVDTPLGVFELAAFLDRGVCGVHREALKAALVDFVETEAPHALDRRAFA